MKKILLIDDSELNRKLLVETLKKSGIKNDIIEIDDGRTAQETLKSDAADIALVYLDWQLPHVDGLEILKVMAQDRDTKDIPVIMLTSSISPESEEIAHMLNPNLKAFIMKPLDPEKIITESTPHLQ